MRTRFEKMNIIKNDYQNRKMLQRDIAEKYGMKIEEVQFVLQKMNYHNGIENTPEKIHKNIEQGIENKHMFNVVILEEEFSFLDKYDF